MKSVDAEVIQWKFLQSISCTCSSSGIHPHPRSRKNTLHVLRGRVARLARAEVVDVFKRPELADEARIIAIPP